MRVLFLALWAAALAGCAGYHLGPTNGSPAGSRSVQITGFVNKTTEPRITEYLASAMRRRLQQDGTFRLQTSGTPDLQVTGEIIRFDRTGLSFATNDVLTPQDYTLILTAHVVARDVATGKTNFNSIMQGVTYVRAGSDLASTEREAIPLLTDDLARNAISRLVDGPW